jgi:hypothetical protein
MPETETGRRIGLCSNPAWLRDGRRIVCNRPGRLVVVDALNLSETEQPWTLSQGPGPASLRLASEDSQLFFLRGTVSADIWVARFDQPARTQ